MLLSKNRNVVQEIFFKKWAGVPINCKTKLTRNETERNETKQKLKRNETKPTKRNKQSQTKLNK